MQILDYQRPSNRQRPLPLPDSMLGRVACWICGVSVVLTVPSIALHMAHYEFRLLDFASGGSLLLCACAGIPLSLGGFAQPGCRKRLAIAGLIGNAGWLLLLMTPYFFGPD